MKIKNTMKYHFVPLDCLWDPQTSMRLQADTTASLQAWTVFIEKEGWLRIQRQEPWRIIPKGAGWAHLKEQVGTSLVDQWLRLQAPNAGDWALILVWELDSPRIK